MIDHTHDGNDATSTANGKRVEKNDTTTNATRTATDNTTTIALTVPMDEDNADTDDNNTTGTILPPTTKFMMEPPTPSSVSCNPSPDVAAPQQHQQQPSLLPVGQDYDDTVVVANMDDDDDDDLPPSALSMATEMTEETTTTEFTKQPIEPQQQQIQLQQRRDVSAAATTSIDTATATIASKVALSVVVQHADTVLQKAQQYKEAGNQAYTDGANIETNNSSHKDDDSMNAHGHPPTIQLPQREPQKSYYQRAIQQYTMGIDLIRPYLHRRHRQEQQDEEEDAPPVPNDNNRNDTSSNDSHHDSAILVDYNNLLVQLYSNRAHVYIKLQQNIEAEQDCCNILQHQQQSEEEEKNEPVNGKHPTKTATTTMNDITQDPKFIAKVWYRRGLAREQHAQQLYTMAIVGRSTTNGSGRISVTPQPQQQYPLDVTIIHHYIHNSNIDLQQCIQVAKSTTTTNVVSTTSTTKEINVLKQQVYAVVQRMNQLETKLLDHATSTTRDNTVSASSLPDNTVQYLQHDRPRISGEGIVGVDDVVVPSKVQQKQHIVELLLSRRGGSSSQQQQLHLLPGEAYFLMEWKWWCQFCHYVELFAATTPSDNNNHSNINTELLRCLPLGASIPDTGARDGPPGPIDNTSLLLLLPPKLTGNHDSSKEEKLTKIVTTDRIYNQHWYRPYYINNYNYICGTTAVTTTNSSNDNINKNNRHSDHADNSNLNHFPTVPIRSNLVRGYHYELLPREVFNALRVWYTETTPSICRRVVATTTDTNDNGNGSKSSRSTTTLYIPLYPLNTIDKAITNSSNNNNNNTTFVGDNGIDECGNCGAINMGKKCRNCLSICYCDRTCQENDWQTHKNECKVIAAQQHKQKQAATKNSKRNGSLLIQPQRPLRAKGRTGLNNLGNTCFMNSAIQCLSHAAPLTRHFLSGRYQNDINRTNPLGTGGQLTVAYAETIKSLHHNTRTSSLLASSISPTKLKHAIAMFAPRFAGYLQHDAQEFLAYLLDGLHEDMNRIRKAPYVEMPDVTDGQCIAIAGATAWEAHQKRNDSVVLDTFYGQFKSTCVCPKCQRVSVSFDVYNHVSLEIPQESNDNIPMIVIVYASPSLTNPLPKPTRYAVPIRRNSNIVSDLKIALSPLCHIPPGRLQICEEHHGTVNIHDDRKPMSLFRHAALIAYEMDPSHSTSEDLNPVFNVVLTNQIVVPYDPSTDFKQQESSVPTPSTSIERIGIPILTSFDASYTCRQIWNHLWSILDFYVSDEVDHVQHDPTQTSPMNIGTNDDFDVRSLVEIRLVVQAGGMERPLFPSSSTKDEATTTTTGIFDANDIDNVDEMMDTSTTDEEQTKKTVTTTLTSILPRDSDETLLRYVGIDQLRNFVFFDCVWTNSEVGSHQEDGNRIAEDGAVEPMTATHATPTTVTPTYRIDEDRFYTVMNDSSYLDYMVKSQAAASKRAVTLDECFNTFTRPERLDVQNMWYCSRCKDHVQALKTMELWKLPNVLIIHLKRFEYKHSLRRDKLDHLVDFPLYGLDMNQHCGTTKSSSSAAAAAASVSCVDDNVPAIYDCFAVVNHYGRMGFGHYTAYARPWNEEGFIIPTTTTNETVNVTNHPKSSWSLFDDSQVRPVHDEQSIVSSAAYVLLYRRRIFH